METILRSRGSRIPVPTKTTPQVICRDRSFVQALPTPAASQDNQLPNTAATGRSLGKEEETTQSPEGLAAALPDTISVTSLKVYKLPT